MEMTDEELIARLRDLGIYSADIAADRIEQLIEGSKGLAEAFATVSVKREMTEAKLAKAVEGLKFYAEEDDYERQLATRDCGCCSYHEDPIILDDKGKLAQATLAELEK